MSSLPLADPDRYVHILGWTFRRGDDSVVCELENQSASEHAASEGRRLMPSGGSSAQVVR